MKVWLLSHKQYFAYEYFIEDYYMQIHQINYRLQEMYFYRFIELLLKHKILPVWRNPNS